jgi:hypothetical protein
MGLRPGLGRGGSTLAALTGPLGAGAGVGWTVGSEYWPAGKPESLGEAVWLEVSVPGVPLWLLVASLLP